MRAGSVAAVFVLLCAVFPAPGVCSPPAMRIPIEIFLSPDCPHCEPIQKEALKALADKVGCVIDPTYRDVDNLIEYKRLVLIERRLGRKKGSDLPIAIIDGQYLGGKADIEKRLGPLVRDLVKRGSVRSFRIPTDEEVAQAFAPGGAAENAAPTIYMAYFEQLGCKECHRVERMFKLFKERFPGLKVKRFSRDDKQVHVLLEALRIKVGLPESKRLQVPAVFVGNEALVKDDLTDEALGQLLERHRQTGAKPCWDLTDEELAKGRESLIRTFRTIGLPAVIVGGLIDGINPCAFATLVFFIGYLTSIGRKGAQLLVVGATFALGIFVAYFLVGLGLSELLNRLEGFTAIATAVTWCIVAATFGFAAFSLVDAVRSWRTGKAKVLLKVPSRLRRYMNHLMVRKLRTRYVVLAALGLGFVVSLLELVCTGQVYLPILQFMNQVAVDRLRAIALLATYNVFFVVPVLIVTVLATLGTTSASFTRFLTGHVVATKIALTAFFGALGTLLLLQLVGVIAL